MSREERELALAVINNWRSSHGFPLNTLQMNLRSTVAKFDNDATIAQRIKRIASIRHKLERFSDMNLSRVQDIGGCRAVVSSVDAVDKIADYYRTQSRMKHKLLRNDYYIREPPPSGYRGTHLVYGYFSDRMTTWNGLRIEIQLRSGLQHAWATAVEIVGTFTHQALKSSLGEKKWLRFFALMSSALALREGTPLVPGTPTDRATLAKEVRLHVDTLEVISRLEAYGTVLQVLEEPAGARGHMFLLELDIAQHELTARVYRDPIVATEAYDALERAIDRDSGKDVVLVSVESLAALRRAYPNYFGDASIFLDAVRDAID